MRVQWKHQIAYAALFIGAQCSIGCAMTNHASLTVQVMDEAGSPIKEASATIDFDERSIGHGLTDDNGMFSFSGPFIIRGMAYAEKDGYYGSKSEDVPIKKDDLGFGLPWNPTVIIVLKRIIEPHPMAFGWLPNIPALNEPCGFDFLVCDWLPPHGNGQVCDAILTLNGWFKKVRNSMNYDGRATMVFPGYGNGMVAYEGRSMIASRSAESHMRSPQIAPENGYSNRMEWFMGSGPYTNDSGVVKDGMYGNLNHTRSGNNYLIRIRTETNEMGQIVSARYGKVEDMFIDWDYDGTWRLCGEYYMNTTTNQNVEHFIADKRDNNVFLRAPPGPAEAYDKREENFWNDKLRKLRARGNSADQRIGPGSLERRR
jgi:hypothetical protein